MVDEMLARPIEILLVEDSPGDVRLTKEEHPTANASPSLGDGA